MSNEVDVSKLTFEQLKKVRVYLKKMIEIGGSDLHIKANSVVRARINGNIVQFSGGVFAKEDAITFAKELLKGRYSEFVEKKEAKKKEAKAKDVVKKEEPKKEVPAKK